jgi:hypothetical protein
MPSTSSPEVSPARTYLRPESAPGCREIARVFGLNSPVSLGSFDPDTYLLKTYQVSLIDGQCQELSENWPDSGMWDLGSVSELLTSARPTSGKGSLSWPFESERTTVPRWPTARQEDGESCGNHPGSQDSPTGVTRTWPTQIQTVNQGPNNHYRGNSKAGRQLTEESRLWRTPDSPGTGGPRNRQDSIGDGHQITIAEQAEHWITPHGMSNQDFRGKVGGCGGGEFAKQANNWQTPATDSFRSRGGDRKDEPGLDQQARMFPCSVNSMPYATTQTNATEEIPNTPENSHPDAGSNETDENTPMDSSQRMFPTPAARDYRTPNLRTLRERGGGSKGEQLQNFVAHRCPDLSSPPDPPIVDGQRSSESSPPSPRRLNPRFVEWLMGFPIGWTEQ